MRFDYWFKDGKDGKVYSDENLFILIDLIKDKIDDDVITAMGEDWYDDQDVEENLDSFYDYLKDPIVYGFGKDCVEENVVTYTAKYSYTFGVEELEDEDDMDDYWTDDDYEAYWADNEVHDRLNGDW